MKTSEVIQRNEEQIRRIKALLKRHEEEQRRLWEWIPTIFPRRGEPKESYEPLLKPTQAVTELIQTGMTEICEEVRVSATVKPPANNL